MADRESSFRKDLPLLLVFASVVILAYSNVYSNKFLYDDAFLIINNVFLRDSAYLPLLFTKSIGAGSYLVAGYYRPLQILTYWIVFQLAGLQTAAFHVPNILFHIANTYLIYCLGRKLNFHLFPLFLATLLWALHPLHVESITYMSATADPLYTFFCLLGTNILLPDFSARRIAWAAFFLVLALLSKEAAIAFPILAGSLLYASSEKRFQLKTYLRLWPFVAITLAYILLHLLVMLGAPDSKPVANAPLSLASSGLTPYVGLPVYLRLILFPSKLYMNHALGATGLLWVAQILLGLAIILASYFQVFKKQTAESRPLSWGLLWFFGAFLPVFHVGTIVYEHWMYLPLAGLFLGAIETTVLYAKKYEKGLPKRMGQVATIAAILWIGGLGAVTWRQNRAWADPETFYKNIIASGDPSPNAHTNLGTYYSSKKNYAAALEQFRLADDAFTRSKDTFTPNGKAALFTDIAGTLFGSSDNPEKHKLALKYLEKALEIDPDLLFAVDKMAEYYEKNNNTELSHYYRKRANALKRQFGHYEGPPENRDEAN